MEEYVVMLGYMNVQQTPNKSRIRLYRDRMKVSYLWNTEYYRVIISNTDFIYVTKYNIEDNIKFFY